MELHRYEIDPDDVPSVPDEHYQFSFEPPQTDLLPEQLSFLLNPLSDDGCSEEQLYLECINVISHLGAS